MKSFQIKKEVCSIIKDVKQAIIICYLIEVAGSEWIVISAKELSAATFLNVTESRIRSHVKQLVDAGFLEERENIELGSFNRTKEYRVCVDKFKQDEKDFVNIVFLNKWAEFKKEKDMSSKEIRSKYGDDFEEIISNFKNYITGGYNYSTADEIKKRAAQGERILSIKLFKEYVRILEKEVAII